MEKNCGNCIYWEYSAVNWGYCRNIEERSEQIGAHIILSGLEKFGDIENEAMVELGTRRDFYCNAHLRMQDGRG